MKSDALRRITKLADQLVAAKADVKTIEASLVTAKAKVTRIEREDLPELMRELKMKNFELEGGGKVGVVDDLECSITEENKPAALTWVKKRGDDGIIKTILSVEFDRDEYQAAIKLAAEIRKLTNKPVEVKESIHHMTLKAYIKELLKKKVKVPIKLFGLHPFPKATLKLPKEGE
jgi:hypothetical protein